MKHEIAGTLNLIFQSQNTVCICTWYLIRNNEKNKIEHEKIYDMLELSQVNGCILSILALNTRCWNTTLFKPLGSIYTSQLCVDAKGM